MLNESRQNISTKESLLFCISGGLFVYFVASIPYIHYNLYPPSQPEDGSIYFNFVAPPIPNKYAFIFSFSLFSYLGIYLLRKLNIQNRFAFYSLLSVILSIGSGILTGTLEAIYYIFYNDTYSLFDRLQEDWFEVVFGDFKIGWSVIFLIAFVPFMPLFLITSSLITKFKNRNSLK